MWFTISHVLELEMCFDKKKNKKCGKSGDGSCQYGSFCRVWVEKI